MTKPICRAIWSSCFWISARPTGSSITKPLPRWSLFRFDRIETGLQIHILTRFLDANRVHFAGKRFSHRNEEISGRVDVEPVAMSDQDRGVSLLDQGRPMNLLARPQMVAVIDRDVVETGL